MKSKTLSILFVLLSFSYTSFSADFSVTITSTASNPTNVSPIPITITFAVSVSDFTAGDITVGNGTVTAASFSGSGTTYTATITPSGEGSVTVDINAGVATNGADSNTAAVQLSRTYDSQGPTVTITSTASNPTNVSTIPITITFSESVSDFADTDIAVGNGTVTAASFSGSGTTYTATITPSGQGAVTVDVSAGVAHDAAGNSNTAATQLSRTYDNQGPTVTITSAASNPTNVSPIPITITFSESVSDFADTDITVGNGTVTAASFNGSGTTYTATITPSGQGAVTVDVSAGVAHDAASNSNTAATQLSRTYDSQGPTVTITSAASNPTNVSPIPITITFSESVSDFADTDITVGNGTVTAASFSGSGTTYTATITPSGQGAVTVDVSAGAVHDGLGNSNTAASQLTRTYDSQGPTVSITSTATNPTNVSPIPITITFSESVSDFVQGDIAVGNGTVTAASFSGSGTTYAATITPSGQGAVTVDVNAGVAHDAAGNSNAAATQLSRTYDSQGPTVTITSTASNPTNVSPIPITITFSESVSDFVQGDITVGNGAVTAASFSGSGTTYTATITPAGQGAVTVNVNAGVAHDGVGNSNTAATQLSRTYDSQAPSVSTVTVPPTTYGINEILPFTITFNEPVVVDTTGGKKPYIEVDFDNGGKKTIYFKSGSGTNTLVFQYKIILGDKDINDNLNVKSDIKFTSGSSIKDLAGNDCSASFSNFQAHGVLINAARPIVISVNVPSPGTYVKNGVLNFTVNYERDITVNDGGGGNNRPYIELTLNSGIVRAYYTSGTGSSNIVFSYTVNDGDLDNDGVTLGAEIFINSGYLVDKNQTSIYADFTLNSIDPTTGVLVDAKPPVINTKTIPAGTYITGNTIAITITADGTDYVADGAVIVNGEPSAFVNMGGGTYKVFYTVQSANTNLNGVSSITSGDLKLKDNAGNKTQVFPVGVVGGTLSIKTKPTYHITGTTSRCLGSPTVPVTFTFTGLPPYNFKYSDGINPVVPINNHPSNTFVINALVGTFTITELSDASGAGNALITSEAATITENPLPAVTFKLPEVVMSKMAADYNLADNIQSKDAGIGVFSGNYVATNGVFYPSLVKVAELGVNMPVTYVLTNSNSCTSTNTFDIKVVGDAAYLSGLTPKVHCNPVDGQSYDIKAEGIIGIVTSDEFKISGATENDEWKVSGTRQITIYPSRFTDKWHTITYTYFQGLNKYTVVDSFNIVRVSATVDFNTLAPKYCSGDAQVSLIASTVYPDGGTGHFESTSSALVKIANATFAYFNPAAATFDTPISISYYYQTSEPDGKCKSATVTKNTIVYSVPSADFTVLKDNYNYNETPVVLVGTPSSPSSKFSGALIEGAATLNPSKADASNIGWDITITYKYVDETSGCSSTKEQKTKVYKANGLVKDISTSQELLNSYCYENKILDISCTPSIDGVSYSGVFSSDKGAISSPTGNTAKYDISIAGTGNGQDIIRFRYKVGPVGDQTDYEITKNILIDNLGNISLNIDNNSRYCANVDPVSLTGLHPDHTFGIGNFSYTGTEAALDYILGVPSFIPTKEKNAGTYQITYTYTSNINSTCSKSDTKTVWVDPVPKANFKVNKDCSDGVGQPIGFENKTVENLPLGGTVTNWLWNWGDRTTPSPLKEPLTHKFSATGSYDIYLRATSNLGCFDDTTVTISIGVGPVANFKWDNDCQTSDAIKFDASISENGPFNEYIWKVDGVSINNTELANISLPDLKAYNVRLIVKRNDDCKDSITKKIVIQPSIKLAKGVSYFDDYESNELNWYFKGDANSIWRYGIPNGEIINSSSSSKLGKNAWYTDINISNQRFVNSQIVSPCFDLSELEKPMIKINIWSAPEPGRDGAVLQYSLDSTKTWNNLGEIGEGINWFSPGNIGSKPANQSFGWSSDPVMTDWVSARHDLDNLKGISSIRFRFIYACDSTNRKQFNGFAFDDFWIGERQQNLLGEYFTNITSTSDNSYLKTFERKKKDDIIPIHYHNNDALYDYYTEGPSSRKFYYGIGQIPSIYANGTIYSNLTDKSNFEIKADAATLMDPKISIDKIEVQNREIKMVIKALTDLSNENLVLYCALVKDSIQINGTGPYYYNVIRRFIPSPGGISLPLGAWAQEGVPQTISLNGISDASEFINAKLVLFVQNSRTNEILQVFSSPAILATSDKPIDLSSLVDVYPNPTRNYLIVECEHTIDRLMVLDLAGRVVGSYIPAETRYSIPVQDLQNGLYILKGTTNRGEFIRKFVKQ